MQNIIDPSIRREVGTCFYLQIPATESEEELRHSIASAMQIENAVESMLDGSMSVWELMEAVEPFVPNSLMDVYIDEVEGNLEDALVVCQCLPAWLND